YLDRGIDADRAHVAGERILHLARQAEGVELGLEALGVARLGHQLLRLGDVEVVLRRPLVAAELRREAGRLEYLRLTAIHHLGERLAVDGMGDGAANPHILQRALPRASRGIEIEI